MKDFIPVRIEDWDEGISLAEWYNRAEREYSDYIAFDYTSERRNWVDDAPEMHRRENPLWNRESKMNANEVIKSSKEWLNVYDLKEKPARVKIAEVELQPSRFQPGTDIFVLSFVGKEKRLGLNKTNTRSLVKLYGAETDDWLGKEITLIPTTDRNPAGEQVPCIRINEMASRTPLVPKISSKKMFDEQNPPPQTRIPAHINSGTLEDEMNDEVPF